MAREFIVPGQIITGSGALNMAEETLKGLGKKALIVTDKVMIQLGNCAKVEAALKNQGVDYAIYSEIVGEPTDVMIENGLKVYKEEGCDFLVALGGGSPIDSMKAIGSLVVNGGNISDYMGKIIDVEMPPLVAIPTTAGTGSEATQFTIITDTKKDIKMLLKGKVLMPSLASAVHYDSTSKDYSGNWSGCTLSCSRSLYIKKSTDTFRYLCNVSSEENLQISSGCFQRWKK